MISIPFFSIIIPTYNREKLLADTINSIIAQTFADWECIIVDDGSTDNSKQLLRSIVITLKPQNTIKSGNQFNIIKIIQFLLIYKK